MTPTQRSLKLMRDRGYVCEITERWNPFAKIRQDLFGFGDVLCLGNNEIIMVQTTSLSNITSRMKKIADHDNVGAVRKAGVRILVHGWGKKGTKWECREEDLS